MSGAIVGIKKQMDLFGVIVLGVCTAVGGGIVRDVILGVTPPATFHDPVHTPMVQFLVRAHVPAARARLRRAAQSRGVRPAAAGDGRGRPGREHGRRRPVRAYRQAEHAIRCS
ncbi:MAG: trimeric intracellular cation channel family protein [Acutalibacteraceae bacterium]